MTLRPVTKLYKRSKATSKNFNDEVMPKIASKFGAIEKPDYGRVVFLSFELRFSLIVTFYRTKTEDRIKKSLTQLSHYCFE